MSTKYKEFIEGLSREALAGVISDEDQAILNHEIETNPLAKDIWQKAVEDYNSLEIQQELTALQLDPTISVEIEDSQLRKRKKLRQMTLAVAALLFLFAGGILWMLLNKRDSLDKSNVLQADLYKDQISLKTGDSTIAIAGDSVLKVGDVVLSNNNGVLKYSLTNGNSSASGLNQLNVPVGKIIKLSLDDGSVITLNSKTTIRFPFVFDKNSRTVYLSYGEIYLDVVADKRPFTVILPDSREIHVLGTSFNVSSYQQNKTVVSLVAGKIKVSTGKESLTLSPNRQAIISDLKITEEPFDPSNTLSWIDGEVFFSSFSEAAEIIDRWYGYKVVFDNQSLAENHISGSVKRKDPLSLLLSRLQKTTDSEYYYEGEIIHFR